MSLAHETAFRPSPATGVESALRSRAMHLVAVLAMAGVAVGFAITYVAHEEPAYFWDWTNYFDRYRAFGAQFEDGGLGWLTTLALTIANADYSVAILTPLMPTYALLGEGRIAYVATIVALYLVPTAWMAARLAGRLQTERRGPSRLWLFAAALLFWPFWIASLRGLPDVAGLVPLGAATLLCIETRFLTRASLVQALSLGFLVWLSFLLRRWYAYADVALEGWCFLFATWTALREGRASLLRTALAYAANLAALVVPLAALQGPLVFRILHTSYAEMYLGYQKPLCDTAALFLAQTGLAVLLAATAGVARAICARNVAALFVVALPATTAVLFLRTQAPSVQHILPVCFWMFPIAVYGVSRPPAGAGRRAAIVAILLAGFLSVLVPSARQLAALARPILPWDAYPPLHLEEPRTYARLIADLETRLAATPGARVAVFASSPQLSGSLLGSLAPQLRPAIVNIADVDARDGFWLAPFDARIAVTTAAPALHLPPDAQRVVAVPAAMIFAGDGPGRPYRRVGGPFRLDGGLEAFVFERDRPFERADGEAWTRAIQAAHPTWARSGEFVR